MAVVISPETRVAELLAAYPEAEDVLIGLAPPFRALRNPLLRRTVAKVTTLEQAARVGGIEVSAMVHALRDAVGAAGEGAHDAVHDGEVVSPPRWIDDCRPAATIDADALLAEGATPVARASELLLGIDDGEVLLVSATFQPAPLIDALRAKGHEVYPTRDAENWQVWIRRRQESVVP